jgi:protein tyrosine/serine phosphatase
MTASRAAIIPAVTGMRTRAVMCGWAAVLLLGGCATPAPDARPADWATPVVATGLPNLYRVSATVYRSAQPSRDGFAAMDSGIALAAGDPPIRTVLSLRAHHTDASLVADPSTLRLEQVRVVSWHLEDEDVLRFLRIVTDPAQQPVLVHCRRGADRTGAMVAVYRVVVEGWSKSRAIEEMKRGGYGFRPVWYNLVRYVEALDVEAIRAQLAAPPTALAQR